MDVFLKNIAVKVTQKAYQLYLRIVHQKTNLLKNLSHQKRCLFFEIGLHKKADLLIY